MRSTIIKEITLKRLEKKAAVLSELTAKEFVVTNNDCGDVKLIRMLQDGGKKDVTVGGYITKKDLYIQLTAMTLILWEAGDE